MGRKKVVVIIALMLVILSIGGVFVYCKLNTVDKKLFNYKETDLIATNEYYEKELKVIEASLDGEIAYSMDYCTDLPGGDGSRLEYQEHAEGVLVATMLYGYPNVSFEELGVEDEMEARMATQFAVWRIAEACAEENKYIFDMKNLKPCEGYEDSLERIKKAARGIIDKAKENPYYANPQLDIVSDESKIVIKESDKLIVGPYKIDAVGYDITELNVGLEEKVDDVILCDQDGNNKNKFENGENIYIKLPASKEETRISLMVNAKGVHDGVLEYGNSKSSQSFCVMENYEDDLTCIQPIVIPFLKGDMKITIIDNYEEPMENIHIRLSDADKNEMKVEKTDSDGIVVFENLPIGDYYIDQIDKLSGYLMYDELEKITVEYGDTASLVIKNALKEGKLKVKSVGEDGITPIKGIIYEILDRDKNVIQKLISDENGIILSKYLREGNYYFREVKGPSTVYIDDEEHPFEIEGSNVTETYTMKHYYTRN